MEIHKKARTSVEPEEVPGEVEVPAIVKEEVFVYGLVTMK
tara:strand:+ start:821 stop:940 length:120 start_codon:yes stop_codon:yes gene_type:complete